jgi:hypothetical protein
VIGGERINGTTKSGRTRVITIDDGTVAALLQHKADQAAEQALADDYWRGTSNGYVFTTGWGEHIYPDTVTTLMTKLIRTTTSPRTGRAGWTSCHTRGCTTCAISTPRPCCCPECRCMWSRPAWAMPTPRSPACMPM